MKSLKRILCLILTMTMAFGVFSMAATAVSAIGTANVECILKKGDTVLTTTDTLKRGDIVEVTLRVGTDYYCGGVGLTWLYDSTYFVPAIDGQPTTTKMSSAPGDFDPLNTFFTFPQNVVPGQGWELWQTAASLSGRVNTGLATIPDALAYPPYMREWDRTNPEKPKLKNVVLPEYHNIHYLQLLISPASGSPASGECIKLIPPQNVVKFSMMVKADAPLTTTGEAHFWIDEGCIKSKELQTGKFFVGSMSTNSTLTGVSNGTDMDYVFTNCDYNFNVSLATVAP